LGLLQNGLCSLIHGLLLLLQDLRVFALLQALEDLPTISVQGPDTKSKVMQIMHSRHKNKTYIIIFGRQ